MSRHKRPLPIGQQSLPDMIKGDFIYIDKTHLIYDLIKNKNYFFLSRPRRFGKTLLISTMEEIFRGNRDLFTSLAIGTSDYSWQAHPVIVVSFATMAPQSATMLEERIHWALDDIAERYGVNIQSAPSLGTKFKSLILKLAVTNNVVILIDEYDAAILKNIENFEIADACREVLADFFSALKDVEVDKKLRFVFITGISKFSKTSIFSGLNNLQDLTLDPRAAHLLGYTEEETRTSYARHLEDISKKTGQSVDNILEQIKFWYNGYRFVDPTMAADPNMYNPYSVMLYLQNGVFDNYWFDTGTPSFLMRLLKAQDYPITSIEESEIHISETKSYEIKDIKLVPLLWQAGYLTIKSYNPETKNFQLSLSNEEVKISFFEYVMRSLTNVDSARISSTFIWLSHAIQKTDLPAFFETLQVFFAQIPYDLQVQSEKHYQSIFFTIMTLIGAHIKGEERTNNGRIDATIETKTHILIFEFKLNDTAESALAQIEEKQYYQKFLHRNKHIILIGVRFSTDTRNISQWLATELD